MALAFALLNLLVILAIAPLRYGREAFDLSGPTTMSEWTWWTLAAVTAGLAGLAIVAGRGRKALARSAARRAALELLLLPLTIGYVWAFTPPLRMRWFDVVIFAAVGVAFTALFVRGIWSGTRRLGRQAGRVVRVERLGTLGLTGRNFGPAARTLAIPTLIMIAVPVVAAFFVGTDFSAGRFAVSLLTYPLYAAIQLVIFQGFLVPRLRELTGSKIVVVLAAAGVFTLVHWPNGLLMAGCAASAIVWTLVYLRRPNIYALAISMGLAATAFSVALPRDITHNLRVGPIYVHRVQEQEQRTQREQADVSPSARVGDVHPW